MGWDTSILTTKKYCTGNTHFNTFKLLQIYQYYFFTIYINYLLNYFFINLFKIDFQVLACNYSTKKSKIVDNALDAIKDVQDGSKILVGGFGLCGIPENLIGAMTKHGAKDLTVISNNPGIFHPQ